MSKRKIVCSICGSQGVNKSSCPLNVVNPNANNWKKHPKAPKKQTLVSKTAPRRKPTKYTNPYTSITRTMCNTTQRLVSQLKPTTKIIMTGQILQILQFRINNPKYKLEIHNSPKNRDTVREYFRLFCDIHRQLQKLIIDRLDFFTRPSASTKKILDLRDSLKAIFIKFLIDNINPSGGTPENIDIEQPVDELLENIQLLNSIPDVTLLTLPEAPSGKREMGAVSPTKIAVPNR